MMQTKSVIFATTFFGARMYAAELEHTFNRPPPLSCLPLKLAAVRQIREAIQKSTVFSDELILGVLFLALSYNRVSSSNYRRSQLVLTFGLEYRFFERGYVPPRCC
jgi:hypothetical protein